MLVDLGGILAGGGPPLAVTATDIMESESGMSANGRVPAAGNTATTCTPSGGSSPYTFLWEKQTDADGDAFIIVSSTAQNAAWHGPNRPDGAADDIETWKVTVTDDDSNTAEHTISIDFRWTDTT